MEVYMSEIDNIPVPMWMLQNSAGGGGNELELLFSKDYTTAQLNAMADDASVTSGDFKIRICKFGNLALCWMKTSSPIKCSVGEYLTVPLPTNAACGVIDANIPYLSFAFYFGNGEITLSGTSASSKFNISLNKASSHYNAFFAYPLSQVW